MSGPAPLPPAPRRMTPAALRCLRAAVQPALRGLLLAGFLLLPAVLLTAQPALAVEPSEMLADPTLEARARDISRELRCLVCQNQSIDDSNAPLAHDLRLLVRQRLVAGDNDDAVKQYLGARYGDYVLMRPPFKPETWALWLGPPLLLLLGGALVWVVLRGRAVGTAETALSPDEEKRLRQLIES
jgi:cytochrome c-type biogenesis protein CcmH